MNLTVLKIENYPVASNCYVLYDKSQGNTCILVDPGSENCDSLERTLEEHELLPEYIILTHEHFDHIWGCNYLTNKYKCKLICSGKCATAIKDPKRNHSLFYNQVGFVINHADIILEDVDWKLKWRKYELDFIRAGGHTESGICFTINKYLFTGDSLIKDLKTVTKLYTGSKSALKKTIQTLESMKGHGYVVCAGHGDFFDLDDYNLNVAYGN